MKSTRLTFTNRDGLTLSGRLELPTDQKPHHFALFAHCFTCSKNLGAVRSVSRALSGNGIAVLRFDFTGLGDSEGNFADTTFSGNVEDLVDAAQFLAQEYQAPSLLIGHSLGGAAVIRAAHLLDSVKAVVTVGAPADPAHVQHLLAPGLPELEARGVAEVNIGGRPFTIKKQFLDDLEQQESASVVKALRKPLLIAHSPQDITVGIENAAALYAAAHHPKSFLSLDGADHLLSRSADAEYLGDVIGAWTKRYLPFPEEETLKPRLQVAAYLGHEKFTTQIQARGHSLVADEPADVGGNDFGMNPYELVSSGLGACTTMTLRMYAERKGWDLQEVRVDLEHEKVAPAEVGAEGTRKVDRWTRVLHLTGNLDEEQRARLLEIADKCPVHRTLESQVHIDTTLSPDPA